MRHLSLFNGIGGLIMAWLVVDKDGEEYLYKNKPQRDSEMCCWYASKPITEDAFILLASGTIELILGAKLSWKDEPFELKIS